MKKMLFVAAMTMMSASAFASKARVSALGGGLQIIDQQTIFRNPADAAEFGDWATFEFGTGTTGTTFNPYSSLTNTATDYKHEGGFQRSAGDARWGFYLGHKDDMFIAPTRSGVGVAVAEENPINFYYASKGDMKWGVGFEYSNSDKKSASTKQSAMVLRGGARSGDWDAYVDAGLSDTADNGSTKMTGSMGLTLGGGYHMDSLYVYGQYHMGGFKNEPSVGGSATGEYSDSKITLAVVDTMKKDGNEFFYGAQLVSGSAKEKANDKKADYMLMPLTIGIEHEAASWLVVRTSVKQNVLLGSHKSDLTSLYGSTADSNGSAVANTIADSTTLAAGLGLKFGKLIVDGTLKATSGDANRTAGDLNAANFLGETAMTYTF